MYNDLKMRSLSIDGCQLNLRSHASLHMFHEMG